MLGIATGFQALYRTVFGSKIVTDFWGILAFYLTLRCPLPNPASSTDSFLSSLVLYVHAYLEMRLCDLRPLPHPRHREPMASKSQAFGSNGTTAGIHSRDEGE